ncbi:very short patch repair endonuclease [Paraburkholderia largidicola]|uniref:very short patch repair endonuclease n=1 Tax=Paraburkholderia largidicola TaxID=3014751 RepID=UPI001FB076D3|nr:DNA mismatch endonuclease Vsr [Paraburkholderia sp. PGU16]
MRRVRQKDTLPELRVRRIAHAMGLRFRLHRKDLPGRPDLVFPKSRICLFVHGCFWHRHGGCRLASTPKSNGGFWLSKFDRNIERDECNARDLEALGWRVVVIWECETRDAETLYQKLRRELIKRSTEESK